MKKLQCPKCHKPVTSEQEFCPGCGQKLEFSAKERRSGKLRESMSDKSLIGTLIGVLVAFGLPGIIALVAWVTGAGHVGTTYMVSFVIGLVLFGWVLRIF